MPKSSTLHTNFTSGEWSAKSRGRFDLAKYQNGAKRVENFLINQLGGGMYRPGTRFIAETKDSDKVSRLIPFQYSADQDYVIETGDEYFRLFSNDANAISISQGFDSYTKLLCHFDGTDESVNIIDEIGNSMIPSGTAQLDDDVDPEFGTASLLLDGDSDYVTGPASTDWNFGTGNFTIDFWVRFTDKTNDQCLVSGGYGADGQNTWVFRKTAAHKLTFTCNASAASVASFALTDAWAVADDTWYHIALVRNGASCLMFINGTSTPVTQTTAFGNLTLSHPGVVRIGARAGEAAADLFLDGHIDELRISKGVARWTANFTAPTTPYAPTTSTEISTSYAEEDLFDLHYAQNNDVLYIVHPDYPPAKLSRTSATNFTIADVDFVRGPFLDTNITAITLTPSADSGAGITVTASAALFDYDGDLDDDAQSQVGSLWRIEGGVVKIVTVTSTTVATADVQAEPDGTAGDLASGADRTDWAEGAFSAYRGYPSTISFHEQRLAYANTSHEPQKFWMSVIGAYDNFDVGTTADDDACTFEVASEQRSAILWLLSGSKALQLGTVGGTVSARTGDANPITATNPPLLSRDTNYGVSNLMPKRISSFIYYIQRDYNKLREISYSFDRDAHIANDMTLFAEHILTDGDGVVDLDHQQSPNDRIYCVRDDGQMAVLTRNPEQDVMGWSRFIAGTDSTGDGVFESVCVIPKASDNDQVWVIVNRTIDGTTKRFIEFFMPEQFDEDWDAVRVDSSLTLDSPKTITGATSANPVVITSASHGFSDGDYVKINGVVGMTDLNGNIYKVANKADDTFELTDSDDADIDGTAYGTYVSGGEARKGVTNISGLSHLEGETVSVQVDGYLPSTETFVVTGGAITLPARAYVVHAGLPYEGIIQLMKASDGSAVGTAQTKIRRNYRMTLRVDRSQGLSVGRDEDNLDDLNYTDLGTGATDLYTGDIPARYPTTWSREDEVIIKQSKPLPADILALVIDSNVEEN